MWDVLWMNLLTSLEEVENQTQKRNASYERLRRMSASTLKPRGKYANSKRSPSDDFNDALDEFTSNKTHLQNATNACIAADLSLGISKTMARNAINKLLEYVGKPVISSEMIVVSDIVRPGDKNWVTNIAYVVDENSCPYAQVYFAPIELLYSSGETSIFQVQHGHINISKEGITYLRWNDQPRGTKNFFTTPLRSAPEPSIC